MKFRLDFLVIQFSFEYPSIHVIEKFSSCFLALIWWTFFHVQRKIHQIRQKSSDICFEIWSGFFCKHLFLNILLPELTGLINTFIWSIDHLIFTFIQETFDGCPIDFAFLFCVTAPWINTPTDLGQHPYQQIEVEICCSFVYQKLLESWLGVTQVEVTIDEGLP